MVLNSTGCEVLIWIFAGLAISLSGGRYLIRHRYNNALGISDVFHLLAVLLLIAFSIQHTVGFPNLNKMSFPDPYNPPTTADVVVFLHYSVAASCTWLFAIYCVKFSFLFFYRTLFGVSGGFITAWWIVSVFTFLCFWASFGATLAECGGKTQDLFNPGVCNTQENEHFEIRILIMVCVTNIMTDVTVMALPLSILRGLRMHAKTKAGLALLFSLATIGIVFDIVRTVYTISAEATQFYYEAVLFDTIELGLAVIISTLVSYRHLFGEQKRKVKSGRRLQDARLAAPNNLLQHEHGDLCDAAYLKEMPPLRQSGSFSGRSEQDLNIKQTTEVV